MLNAVTNTPDPINEPVLSFAPGTPERTEITEALGTIADEQRELPLVIDGEEVKPGNTRDVTPPHDHQRVIAKLHQGGEAEVNAAVKAAMGAREEWAAMAFDDRAAILLRAADLLAGPYRARANAATMLGQSKTAHQAEIDAACELIDFWRFNVHFARRIMAEQPISSPGIWNRLDHRPLDGFVLAISPFNFSSIAGNLATAPALMGNTVVWKPATTGALSAQVIMDILIEAGMPPGVINLCHAPGSVIGKTVVPHPDLAGIHFTGSTGTFQRMWKTVGENIANYHCYPRLVGETGGKDFIFAHASADVEALAVAILRGSFEYQGQKCSASSRVYVPESLWKELSGRLEAEVGRIKMGDPANFENFMGAVIDKNAFADITGYIDFAKNNSGGKVWLGGNYDDSKGYFIEPTVVLAEDPMFKLMKEEIFGPVVTIHRYPDAKLAEAVDLCDTTSPYALTGAVFARDRQAVVQIMERLRFAAGNFYINDKPTGAVVGQQPFGGGRASGTNDKAGSPLNLQRWVSPRAVKETLLPPTDWTYPFMGS